MWPNAPDLRVERHYGNRFVQCYANRPTSVDSMLAAAAQSHSDSIASIDGDVRQTYGELSATATVIAGALWDRGIRPGDTVGILLDNRTAFGECFFGILRAGAIAVPLNIRDQADELEYRLSHAGVKCLFYESSLAERIPDRERSPELRHRISVGSEISGSEPYGALLDSQTKTQHQGREDDVVTILYTSGTTGAPKGAMLTNLSIISSVLNYETCWRLRPGDRAVMAVPASHVTGLVALLLTMVRVSGSTIYMRDFKASRFLSLAAQEGMTHTILVPAMYNLCLMQANLSNYDLRRWRVGGYGGAPMPPASIKRMASQLPAVQLVNAYGATETTSPTTLSPLGSSESHPDAVGVPVPTARVLILDSEGRELPRGTEGDIWIHGSNVVPGYWRNEPATRDSFIGSYWNSGDVGLVTVDGYLRILDRKKDLINRGGYKVYSAEVEAILMRQQGVTEAAVIPLPDSILGEKTLAILVSSGKTNDAESVRAFCAEHLSDYKVPDFIAFMDEPLPRNAAGKILKRELAAKFRDMNKLNDS